METRPTTSQSHPRVLCIWLPNWPIQRLNLQLSTAHNPTHAALRQASDGPLILSARDTRRGQIVAAVNLAGRQAGVRPAMRLSEATALVAAEVHPHDPQEDIEELCGLAEQAQQFSPLVGLEQLDKKTWAGRTLHQPECLLLDVTGIAALFGGETELLEAVCQWLSGQHYFGCVALAGSVGAAWALANYQLRQPVSSDVASPDAVKNDAVKNALPACRHYRAPLGEDVSAIADLPLAALRLPPDTVQALRRLGVRTLGQLQQLPRGGLATRLGEPLLLRWDQAAGRQPEPIITLHASPDWSVQQTLEFPTGHRATMEELVRRLTGQLAERLGRRGEGALRIVCRLDLVQSPPLVLQLGLFRPNSDAHHLQVLLVGQLEQQLRGLAVAGGPPPLWRVSLQATLTAPLVWRQIDLFEAEETVSRQQIARLVDTLSSRLGRKQVLGAQVRREAQPELSCQLQPLTGRRPDGGEQDTFRKLSSRLSRQRGEPSRDDPQRRPTQLFSPPVTIQVAAAPATATAARQRELLQTSRPADSSTHVAAQVGDRPAGNSTHVASEDGSQSNYRLAACPARFYYQGRWLDILEATGPERLESGWWRGPSVRRDYYRVATNQTGWWWIYRDLNTGQWYLHGAFD